MKSFLLFTSFIASTWAAPATWSPEMAAIYSATSYNIFEARASGAKSPPSCDVSNVNITQYMSTIPGAPDMPTPDGTLIQVTLGRGTQNYTCADNQATTIPKAMGAVAKLYNASCLAANYPNVLTLMPAFALQYNLSDAKLAFTNMDVTGHHYFNSNGVPTFDLNDGNVKQGVLVADGKNPAIKVNAPASAAKGQIASGSMNGAVAWLKLMAQTGTTNNLADVYRIDTAGGSPPANCSNQPAVITIEYASQYWFYKNT